MRIEKKTHQAIQEQAPNLRLPPGLEAARLLLALSVVESSGGFDNRRRVEPAYRPGGRYCVRELYDRYGDDAAASWGPLQVMYVTAHELGFRGSPQELGQPREGVRMAVELINRRITGRGAATLEEVADAYNSGSFRDGIVPHEYMRRVGQAYQELATPPEVVEQAAD